MNNKSRPPVDNREWTAQERGLRAARDEGDEPMDREAEDYRLLARAVASAPRSEPPLDFAAAVAAKVRGKGNGWDRGLAWGLLVVLAVAAAIVATRYAGPAWQAMEQGLSGGAPWAAAGAGCIALSWVVGQARQLRIIAGTDARACT